MSHWPSCKARRVRGALLRIGLLFAPVNAHFLADELGEGQNIRNSLAGTVRLWGTSPAYPARLRRARLAVGAFAIECCLGLVRGFGEECHKEFMSFVPLAARRFKETAQDAVVD